MRAPLLALAAAAACVVSTGPTARADFLFNPTGVGGLGGAVLINGFDPAPGNSLAKDSVTAINNVIAAGGTGADVAANRFQLYYMATTSSLIGPSPANNPLTPAGLNTTYQITYVASITEFVKTASGPSGTATFGVSSVQAPNSILQIYDNAPAGGIVADNASGTGFTAGTLILSAAPVTTAAGSGNFTTTGATQLFDQHGADNFGGKLSVVGQGSSTIDFNIGFTNASYFITPPPTIIALRFNTSQSTPFLAIEPTGAVAGTGFPNPLGAPNPILPALGAINGVSGPDFQFVADAFVTPVPEPSSLCLMGLGLAGVLAVARRKRAQVD